MSYERELDLLKETHLRNREKILEKYKELKLTFGLDGEPYGYELREETKRFQNELNNLKKKYNK